MLFTKKLQKGTLIRRYKRFLADVELAEGNTVTVHCPNSGSMMGCSESGSPVLLSRSDNPSRKYPFTLEMVRTGSTWIGVNTSLTNKLVREALETGVVSELGQIDSIKQEVKTSASTRLDFLLTQPGRHIYLEVKNCSLVIDGAAMFPDAVTKRGTKHLLELSALRRQGYEAAVFFCVQRDDAHYFKPAGHIDPLYAETLWSTAAEGVKVLAYRADVSPEEILLVQKLPVQLTT